MLFIVEISSTPGYKTIKASVLTAGLTCMVHELQQAACKIDPLLVTNYVHSDDSVSLAMAVGATTAIIAAPIYYGLQASRMSNERAMQEVIYKRNLLAKHHKTIDTFREVELRFSANKELRTVHDNSRLQECMQQKNLQNLTVILTVNYMANKNDMYHLVL